MVLPDLRLDSKIGMKLFVINLKRSERRRLLMESQLDGLDLDWEFVEAIDGHALTDAEIDFHCDSDAVRRNPNWLTRGALGAALSHQKAQRLIVSRSLERALILEDDLYLPLNFGEILARLESEHARRELILLYWSSSGSHPFYSQSAVSVGERLSLAVSASPLALLGGVGYILDSEVAQRISKLNSPVHVSADLWSYHLNRGAFDRIRCLVPSPLRLAHLPSDIGYGNQSRLKEFKRFLEERVPFVNRLSAIKRERYFSKRTRVEWI